MVPGKPQESSPWPFSLWKLSSLDSWVSLEEEERSLASGENLVSADTVISTSRP